MSHWRPYFQATYLAPSELDRARLQRLIPGTTLPDDYWRLVMERQGQVLEDARIALPGQGELAFGLLLFALAPAVMEKRAGYTVERSFTNMQDYYPAGILPFADDTGGNNWAFDYRRSKHEPAIVFVDHEVEGDEGISPVAPDFATFIGDMGAPVA